MARIRTIKPEFWHHEDLSELHCETHMLAAALLNQADDEGYFNANEKLITASCFPLRNLSTSIRQSIDDLSTIGYIRLFPGTDGKKYGHIVKFSEHQRVDRKKDSKIKLLECFDEPSSIDRRAIDSRREGKGREREGNPSLSFGNDVKEAFNEYNILAEKIGLPKAQALTKARAGKIGQRLKSCNGIDGWRYALEQLEGSPHCRGDNDRGWRADLDFVCQEKSFTKLMEGSYASKKPNGSAQENIFDELRRNL